MGKRNQNSGPQFLDCVGGPEAQLSFKSKTTTKKKETTLLASISDAMETLENKLCN